VAHPTAQLRRRGRSRKRDALPAGAAADLLELGEEQVELLGLGVEVWRDPDPDAGPMIAEELAAVELAADVGRARRDRPAPLPTPRRVIGES